MSSSLRRKLAFRILFPFRYRYDEWIARPAFAGSKCRLLLVSDRRNSTSEAQFDPLLRDRVLLRTHGVILDQRLLADVLASQHKNAYDVILAKISFYTPEDEALRQMEQLRAAYPEAAILYMDGDDDACVQWPGLLPHVDLYVKKHMFADTARYQEQFTGKSNLTDYVARRYGRSFADDTVPHSSVVPPEQLGKVVLGWNIAEDDKIVDLFAGNPVPSFAEKTVDVMCRAACAEKHWIYPLRGPVSQALAPLADNGYRVLLPTDRVDQQTYYNEMRTSRLCVSPFGYGELCWRDFEAVILGCLLIKPEMSHLTTEPNLFVPGETYVPCAWDFGDLAEICEHYLQRPEEAARIAANAYRTLQEHYQQHTAVKRFLELLSIAQANAAATHTGSLVDAV